ncbi:MAG: osmoprotectant transport system substrate-binding protein [Pseudonocardiales bacterium]|nr:osmoprotectant transport system substrate-binding protein [Pseudonocardiales bacterium]
MSNPVTGAVRRPAHRTAAVAALAVLTLVLAGCGGGAPGGAAGSGGGAAAPSSSGAGVGLPAGTPGQGKPAVTVGDKDFSEAFLIGDLYEQALKAKGYTVNLKANVGGSEVIDSAFKAGQIDVYPEYTGEILSSVAGDQGRTTSAEETWQKAKAFEEANRGATLLPQTPFQDIDVVIVKPEFASAHNLKAIGDLKNVGPGGQGVSWAAQPPDKTRYAGLVGMQQAYGLTNVAFVGVDVGVTYSALDTGTVNSADAFSTDGQLTTNKYTVLDDPEHIMGFQHVAPVVKQSVLAAQGPEFAQTLNWVDSLLTQQAILQMNAAIQLNHVDPATVAQKFLAANGLQS